MTPLSDQQVERLRDCLPTAEEVAAHVLFCCVVWGCLELIVLECLP
ncbi:hypothetical protein [Novacetimonas sp. GS1]